MKRIIYVLSITILLSACGTTKKVTKTLTPPEGISFVTVKNFGDFASIEIPVEGKGFKNKSSSANEPHVFLNNDELRCLNYDFSKKDGDLNFQYNFLIEKYKIKPENVISTESMKLGDKNVIKFELIKHKSKSGNMRVLYGYLVENNQRASLFMYDTGMPYTVEKIDKQKKAYDEGFLYTIKTIQYK